MLWRHNAQQVVGKILALHHNAKGELYIRAEVHDPLAAAATHFSVGCTPTKYELVDVDDPANFHALITAADCLEVSLTNTAANAHARVTNRYAVPASVKHYDLALQWVVTLQKMAQVIAHQVVQAQRPAPPDVRPLPVVQRPPTQFSQLVTAMQEANP